MLDFLFVVGCFLVWLSVGTIVVVKHRAKNGKKANMLAPGIMMVLAIALIAAPKVFG